MQKDYEKYSDQIKEKTTASAMVLAAELGFEPRQTESESVVLTVTQFGYICGTDDIISLFLRFVNSIMPLFSSKYSFFENFFENVDTGNYCGIIYPYGPGTAKAV